MSSSPDPRVADPRFAKLYKALTSLPAIDFILGSEIDQSAWWVKFRINIDHPQAWEAVQRLGHILNYLPPPERLPTIFRPVSAPPYLNGGPRQFLYWVIECFQVHCQPDDAAKWIESVIHEPIAGPDAVGEDEEE